MVLLLMGYTKFSRRFLYLSGLPTDTKRTTVGDRRVLNSKCPKHVGCFGSSTRFQMRKVVGKWYEWYRFCKKIMSLVYAKISDDIGMCFMCASRVSTCECSVDVAVWYRDTWCTRHQIWVAMLVRESTYLRSSPGSRRRSASRYLPRTRVRETHY